MNSSTPIRVGLMGFGHIGRQIYHLASQSDDFEIVAIADIGDAAILHYLLCSEVGAEEQYQLDGNFMVNRRFRSRMMPTNRPAEMSWDLLKVDFVIDSTAGHRGRQYMQDHIDAGAPRVLLRGLPEDHIDRIVVPGVNAGSIQAADRMLSAGSPTSTALALLLHVLSASFEIECVSLTTVHAYTSDQPLQDYAGVDFRRSRSAAKNIIPNSHEGTPWLSLLLPALDGKVMMSALNVPVQQGCLLDTNLVFADAAIGVDEVNDAMRVAAQSLPGIVDVVEDPIVSSDVIGNAHSLLFDTQGTIKAGEHTIKALGWYESLGHASRLLDVMRLYADLDQREEAA
jgi:glyceraldehyde 3-phosphate dehydrogenase